MFSHLSVILFTGGCLPHPPGIHLSGRPAQCMLGYTPLPSACWDAHTPAQSILGYTLPRAVHAGIRSKSGRYASYWNAFLLYKYLKMPQALYPTYLYYSSNLLPLFLRWVYACRIMRTHVQHNDRTLWCILQVNIILTFNIISSLALHFFLKNL